MVQNRNGGEQRTEFASQTQVISRFLDSQPSNQSIIMGFCPKVTLKNIVQGAKSSATVLRNVLEAPVQLVLHMYSRCND